MKRFYGIAVILFLMGFIFWQCDLSSANLGYKEKLSFEDVPNYQFFQIPEAGTMVIRDDSTWQSLYDLYFEGTDSTGAKLPIPQVDFSKKMVIAVTYGGGCVYSGCTNRANSIDKIVRVIENQDTLRIEVTVGEMDDLGPCQTCAFPLHMVMVEKFNGEVDFLGQVPGSAKKSSSK